MPIYAYKCESCGHAKDVLQKISDAPLTTCPSCGADAFRKQLTAAGFQLKGSGWYVTDFRGGSSAGSAAAGASAAPASGDSGSPAAASSTAEASKSDSGSSSSSSGSSPAGGGCGSSCGCH